MVRGQKYCKFIIAFLALRSFAFDFLPPQRSRVWFLGANLQWGINDYPKLQLRRNVLFRFEDLLGKTGKRGRGLLLLDIIENRFAPSPLVPLLLRRLHRCSLHGRNSRSLPRLQSIELYRIYILFHLAICQVVLRWRRRRRRRQTNAARVGGAKGRGFICWPACRPVQRSVDVSFA